jgi:predicted nucleic acid-binding protein
MKRLVVLDNEAVQALMDTSHPQHQRALEAAGLVAGRRRKAWPIELVVPTAVRVEAGWDRRRPESALINRQRVRDAVLDRESADTAADLVAAHGVSVADAHIGAVIAARHEDSAITVVTSDPDDMRLVAGSVAITLVRL